MRNTRSILVILGVAVLMATSAATVAAGGRPIVVEMTGAQEAPGPGDPDGTGTASFWINPGQEELCFVLEVQTLGNDDAARVTHTFSGKTLELDFEPAGGYPRMKMRGQADD